MWFYMLTETYDTVRVINARAAQEKINQKSLSRKKRFVVTPLVLPGFGHPGTFKLYCTVPSIVTRDYQSLGC
jgi:hypothetical protein